ncbi:rust resistance kinase Lr10-like isoform X2 [Salvia hispanica]|uniref:rust resistance kinase Lr10-like isoform X2 n=1 Tax=Salvia hispanica TaxID=49212 RepID=UPI002009AEFF|nr:rust resistance kinase Lr10-like isoform X2 [Salvia hispanica]
MITTHQNLIFLSTASLILSLHNLFESCDAKCTPVCGIISNISYPFGLKGDSNNCGDSILELACENNVTYFSLNSHKYYVKAINFGNNSNYDDSTIRLVDASINNDDICSFPTFSTYNYNFIYGHPRRLSNLSPFHSLPINFISCPNPLTNSSFFTDITTHCVSNSSHHKYAYIKVGHMNASEVPYACGVDLIAMTSWYSFKDLNNVSLSEIHESLLYGFELRICPSCGPSQNFNVFEHRQFLVVILDFIILSPRVAISALVLWLLIYKFRRRHLSEYNTIETFLQSDNKLSPIRYSYSDIKRMTRGFQEKLGEGGYGCVYKGKLRSGQHVAVKMLGKSGGNGQDFMNEIATIGRIHHINVVKLVGYCAQGSKRALIFDFMPNGSLEKYLFNRDNMDFLNWETKFHIAVGIARGIEYLHRGCDIQILHFDIKPHNILLDHNFIPKISDFGLAKLCSVEEVVTLTVARGTIGYVAPELINRSIGRVSSKADVYSFGMLLMEMLGLNRELRQNNDDSTKYFPYWIYDQLNQAKEIEIEKGQDNNGNDENGSVRKMTIVALCCIRMSPDDRPSMNKVLGMLEGDVECLQMPEYPSSQSTQIAGNEEESWLTDATDSVSLLHHNNASNFEITIA